jgi:exonuclease III
MNVVSWNVQGAFPPQGSPDRIDSQLDFIVENADCPDLLMLNEVTKNRRELWHEGLERAGYTDVVDTLDWARQLGEINVPPFQDFNKVNGNLTAVHKSSDLENLRRQTPSIRDPPHDESALKHWDTNFPEKILNAEVDLGDTTIDLWNIRTVPGSMFGEEKIKILENVYDRILAKGTGPRILAGDFNAPKDETDDGEVIPWRNQKHDELSERWKQAELNILTGLDAVGMVDVFRTIHGYGELDTLDISHPTGDRDSLSGKRFDHIIASRSLNPHDCFYDVDGLDCSDHAPLFAEFYPDFSS